MEDRREILLKQNGAHFDEIRYVSAPFYEIRDAMDDYFRERALELLEYMAKKGCGAYYEDGRIYFTCCDRCGEMTKEQLFENFL